MTTTSQRTRNEQPYSCDEARWQAVATRDPTADGVFFYSVRTTGVYCRPVCAARLALRKNVRFHESYRAAEAAGFRPCKRCRPKEQGLAERQAELVAAACRAIERADAIPRLDELASAAGLSRFHFHRIFKAQTGLTPKAYAAARRAERMRDELSGSATVTAAIYDAGFNSNGRFYAVSNDMLGMTPKAYRGGGSGTKICFAIRECWLGSILVAATHKGVCAISLGDDADELSRDLQDRFPKAEIVEADEAFERNVEQVVAFVAQPSLGLNLPLDIRGTAFQQRVWNALREIPAGKTVSYSNLAQHLGLAKSVRAVASACAANSLAVAIPCHRVVRSDGSLSGYRWGVERKAELQQRERETMGRS